jgi:dTDP-4-amino-4,6-dideoxygalactose transaminase
VIKVSRGCLGDEELAGVREVFDAGYFGLGRAVTEFEAELKRYVGAEHVVATNTGTSALHLALDALGIGNGDEVIVPSLTFVASFQAIAATGARPVPCDVTPDTLLMDVGDAERKITPRTMALMPVHYAGNPCDMEALLKLKERRGVRIVEDAAHAFGSTYRGRKVGSFGDVVCFSFDSIKTITCGEGGAVACFDEEMAEVMRRKRVLGINRNANVEGSGKESRRKFEVATNGFRYHMSSINAAIGLAQLKKADGFIARRREICRRYDQAFGEIRGLQILRVDYREVAPHIYVVRVKNERRDALMEFLKDADIEAGMNYIPNHLHAYFWVEGVTLPETERAYQEILTLPLHCGLPDGDVDCVIRRVREFFQCPAGRTR